MNKNFSIILLLLAFTGAFKADAFRLVDATAGTPLPLASVTDRSGNVVGLTDKTGEIPALGTDRFPVTFNYMGYEPLEVPGPVDADVKMNPRDYDLPEIVITTDSRPLLRLTGYMRELTSVLNETDSVTIFRESMVDFLVPVKKTKVKGWDKARQLASRTYVRMTDSDGLDSVSAEHEYEFILWGDKQSLIPDATEIPEAIRGKDFACDTIMGKFGPKAIWWKNGDKVRWYGDALANNKDHKASPLFLKLLGFTADFTELSKSIIFDAPDGDLIKPTDLRQLSLTIDMLGRGKWFKKGFESKSPVNVRSYMELYLTDREFLTEEEGRELKKEPAALETSDIVAPAEAAPLHPAIRVMVGRVRDGVGDPRK